MGCGNEHDHDHGDHEEHASSEKTNISHYGDEISPDGAISMDQLQKEMKEQAMVEAKVEGTIIETCSKKGCWMSIATGGEDEMIVRFKDYGFFVPTEGVDGKKTIMEGVCSYDTLSVDVLRHYAEDAGKTQDEIDAITQPEYTLAFEASGVIIEDVPVTSDDDDEEGEHEEHEHGEEHSGEHEARTE